MSTKVDQKFVAPPTTPFDVVFELFVSLAKKYFFLEVIRFFQTSKCD
jgi:hypothetical protein